MLIFQNATSPALRRISSPRRTITRRDRQTVSTALNILCLLQDVSSWCAPHYSLRRGLPDVAHEQRPRRGDQVPRLHTLADLHDPVLLETDGDRPLDQVLTVRRDPHHHRAVALAHEGVRWDGGCRGRRTGQNAEGGEHVRLELAITVV